MKKILLASQTVSDKKCDSISEFDTIETGMTSYEKKQVESLQSEIMELVAIFSELCEINLIDYSLYGGSLLGSIRHRGFIPWDDDFDIVMTRSNFEKFKIAVESESKLKLSQEKTWLHILRLDEITIDIFIMDYTSSNDKKFKKQVFKNKIVQGMLKKKINFKGKSIFQNTAQIITKFLGLFLTRNAKLKLYEKNSTKFNNESKKCYFVSDEAFNFLNIKYDAKKLTGYEYVSFNNVMLKVFANYNIVLKKLYGDYMKLPPINKRVPEHILRKL